jgi:hypothetical protein
MPLLDHFHPPLLNRPNPESFIGTWASHILQRLNQVVLPDPYEAEAEVSAGPRLQIDIAAVEHARQDAGMNGEASGGTGTAVQTYTPTLPPLTAEVRFEDPHLIEVRVSRPGDARIAAAIELVSRSNKDRPDSRRAFAIKCASYLQAGISVVVVDIVTERHSQPHADLVELLDLPPALQWTSPTGLSAVSYRLTAASDLTRLDVWPAALQVGTELPTVPLWLAFDLAVPLELDHTYALAVASYKYIAHPARPGERAPQPG